MSAQAPTSLPTSGRLGRGGPVPLGHIVVMKDQPRPSFLAQQQGQPGGVRANAGVNPVANPGGSYLDTPTPYAYYGDYTPHIIPANKLSAADIQGIHEMYYGY